MSAYDHPRSMQIWPGGDSVTIKGDPNGPDLRVKEGYHAGQDVKWKKPSKELRRRILIEEMAERYSDREIFACDSCLVDMLLQRGDIEGFTCDDLQNVYPDPDSWDAERCADWLDGKGISYDEREEDEDDDDYEERLRGEVRDNSEPQEVFEWWRVSSWLCGQLSGIGEVVIDNDYGYWWGRTCTGQGYLMDGTLQSVAAQHVRD